MSIKHGMVELLSIPTEDLYCFQDAHSKKELNTYVVSASVTNATIRDLEQQVTVTLRHLKPVQVRTKGKC